MDAPVQKVEQKPHDEAEKGLNNSYFLNWCVIY